MSTRALLFLVLNVVIISCLGASKLPSGVGICHLNEQECLLKQANKFIKACAHGCKELGFSTMEPVDVGNVDILGASGGSTQFDIFLKDLKIYNYSSIRFVNLKFVDHYATEKPLKLTLSIAFDKPLVLKGRYKATGKILILPINGDGDLEWTLSKVRGEVVVTFIATKQDDGHHSLKVNDLKTTVEPEHINIHMTNLVKGNPEISAGLLDVINKNWRLISGDIFEQVLEKLMVNHEDDLKTFFNKFTWEELFLSDTKTNAIADAETAKKN